MSRHTASSLTATQKTCRILAVLSDPRVNRLTDIADRTGLDRSTALRILKELEGEGFVERDPVSKVYVLGPQVYAMHHAMVHGISVRDAARASLIRLSRRFGDTVILSVPTGCESICVDLCFGDYPIRANYLDVGSRRPLGVGAGSLALLADMASEEVAAIRQAVDAELLRRYPRYSPARLDEELALAHRRGHVMLLDVVVEKMGGLGVAVRGPDRRPIAALSIAALTERIEGRESELAEALAREARDIEHAWMPA
ncbi:IclR family transcriptional regulator [Verticiella sediminum]|uniref:IclR family transcriptional regulator n=1 Tax=Verticiella sediminum TaxID=1247510 RepID=A0A556B1C3_9BURK|nr:IclR family transcriptional regulator [Verticiella sediminum]TSH98963.1 IclR family transcriptional regulator [Verticiella sediminum]